MNLYIIALLESLIQENLSTFSLLNFVKSAIYLCDVQKLSLKFEGLAVFYFDFLQKINFLPEECFQEFIFGPFDLKDSSHEITIQQVFSKIKLSDTALSDAMPVDLHYMDEEYIHFVSGLVRFEKEDLGYYLLIDLKIFKGAIKAIPHSAHYVIEFIKSYDYSEKKPLRELIRAKGFNYNQFQKDCKLCFGDTFYSFLLKLKMLSAVNDIVFSTISLKEIAFKNHFLDYGNMYKTFVRYGVNPTQIPRIGNL